MGGDGVSFIKWCADVDYLLYARYGVGRDDLPDAPWADWYDDGLSAQYAIEAFAEDMDECL